MNGMTMKDYWQRLRGSIAFVDFVAMVRNELSPCGKNGNRCDLYEFAELDALARRVIAEVGGNGREKVEKPELDGLITIPTAWRTASRYMANYMEFAHAVRDSISPVMVRKCGTYYDEGKMSELIERLKARYSANGRAKFGRRAVCDRCGCITSGNEHREWLCGDCWTHEFAHRPQSVHCDNFGEYISWRKENKFEELSDEDKDDRWRKVAGANDVGCVRV